MEQCGQTMILKGRNGKNIEANVIGLGEGGLVGCSILAECVCPLLLNPCYMKCRLIYDEAQFEH